MNTNIEASLPFNPLTASGEGIKCSSDDNTSKRIEWVDIAKGYGIIAVILGHVVFVGSRTYIAVFAFHMPFFLIIAGFFIPRNKNSLFKRFKQFVIYYIVSAAAGLILVLCVPQWKALLSIKGILRDIYLLYPSLVLTGSVWFLPVLFIAQTIIFLIEHIKIKKPLKLLLCGAVVLLGFGLALTGKRILTFLPSERLPFGLDTGLVAVLFVALGHFLKDKIYKLVCYFKIHKIKAIVAAAVGTAIFLVAALENGVVNLCLLTFNNVFLYILSSVIGTVVIIIISALTENLKALRFISMLGKNSLLLMIVHAVFIKTYILIVNLITGQNYRMSLLPTPYQVPLFLATLLFCVLICCLKMFLKNITHKRVNKEQP